MRDEVPHGIGVEMMGMEKMNDNFMEINATIYCERDAHKGIIIGKHGAMLQTIGSGGARGYREAAGAACEFEVMGEGASRLAQPRVGFAHAGV